MTATPPAQSGSHFTLAKPAIELAVAEVRFRSDNETILEPVGLAFREAIRVSGLALDSFEPVVAQEVNIEMTNAGARTTGATASQGWACRDTVTGIVVTLMPFSVAVQTRAYARWSETFQPILEAALDGVAELLGPSLRTRIGLRYVNRFVDPEAHRPGDWAARFHPSLLGPVTSGPLAECITSSQQQLEVAWEGGLSGLIRHGAFVDSAVGRAYSYLLDLDVSDGATEPFDRSECLERLTQMNRASAELFKSLLAEHHLEERGLSVEVDEGATA